MNVRIKLDNGATVPFYSTGMSAGMDIKATSVSVDDNGNFVYGTGIHLEIPEGYVGLLFPRSSVAKMDISLRNCVGVIDADYRGEVTFKFGNPSQFENPKAYEVGDRIGQLIIMPFPRIEFEVVDSLSETERGDGGYGSTGK